MLMQKPSYSNCSTEDVTEIPLSFSISIQSDTACLAVAFPFTLPARLMAPPYNRNFSVSVVLPASGCEIMAKVLLLLISASYLLFIATFLPVVFLFLLFYLLQHRFSGNISGYSKVIEHCCTDIRKSFSRTEIFRSYMLSVHDTRCMLS